MGGLLDTGESCECLGDIVADDLAIDATEADQQPALAFQIRAWCAAGIDDMHADEVGARATGDARRATDEVVPTLAAKRNDHPLANATSLVGDVGSQLSFELFLNPIGQPQQGQLTQLAQHLGTKDVGQCGVDAVGRIHVSVSEPPTKRLWAHVDELDLIRCAHD